MPSEAIQKYFATPTDIGTAKIANAVLTGKKVNVTHFAVGDGGGSFYLPEKSMTELRNEVWRTALSHAQAAPEDANVLDFYAIIPPEVGGFTIREMAIFDDAGDMIGVCNTPDVQKVTFDEGVSFDSVLIISLAVVAPEVLQFKIDPYVIIATLHDLNAHNISPQAHEDIREELELLNTGIMGLVTRMEAAEASLLKKANKDDTITLQRFVMLNGYLSGNLAYFKDEAGYVNIEGHMAKTTLPIAGEVIAQLPVGYRPSYGCFMPLIQTCGKNSMPWCTLVVVTPEGDIKIHSEVPSGSYNNGVGMAFGRPFKAAL